MIDSESPARTTTALLMLDIAELCLRNSALYWHALVAPFGRAEMRPSAALRSLELARPVLRSRALQLRASRRAEPIIISVQRY